MRKFFRVTFHCFLSPSKELPEGVFPIKCSIIRAENQSEAKSAAEYLLAQKYGQASGFYLTENEELKMYEISLRDIQGGSEAAQSEDFGSLPVKEKFFAASLDEAKGIAKTRETSFGKSSSGRVLQYGPTEIGE